MTKAEIIEYLYENHVRADITLEEMADDLSVELSAQLAQDLPITCTDTISRADAIKAFCERCGNLGEPCDGCNDIPLLYSLPSAQPECEDAVSRAELIETVRINMENDRLMRTASKDEILSWIDELQSVTPKAPECEDVSDTNVGKMCEYYDLCRNGRDEKKLREELLSAQPERKKGKWIYKYTEPFGYICSECRKAYCRYNFCPNCGADMRGDSHG